MSIMMYLRSFFFSSYDCVARLFISDIKKIVNLELCALEPIWELATDYITQYEN